MCTSLLASFLLFPHGNEKLFFASTRSFFISLVLRLLSVQAQHWHDSVAFCLVCIRLNRKRFISFTIVCNLILSLNGIRKVSYRYRVNGCKTTLTISFHFIRLFFYRFCSFSFWVPCSLFVSVSFDTDSVDTDSVLLLLLLYVFLPLKQPSNEQHNFRSCLHRVVFAAKSKVKWMNCTFIPTWVLFFTLFKLLQQRKSIGCCVLHTSLPLNTHHTHIKYFNLCIFPFPSFWLHEMKNDAEFFN